MCRLLNTSHHSLQSSLTLIHCENIRMFIFWLCRHPMWTLYRHVHAVELPTNCDAISCSSVPPPVHHVTRGCDSPRFRPWQPLVNNLPCLYFVVFPPWLSCVTCREVLFCIVFMMGAYRCIVHITMKLQQRVNCVYHLLENNKANTGQLISQNAASGSPQGIVFVFYFKREFIYVITTNSSFHLGIFQNRSITFILSMVFGAKFTEH